MSLDSFPIAVAVGTALGFLSGLGVGGWKPLILVWAFCSVGGTVMCVMNLKKWTGFIVH